MSIQRRLSLSITLVLLFSLLVGAVLTYGHVLGKVRTEMQAALAVATHSALNAVDDAEEAIDPAKRLQLVVDDFNGDRHVQAVLRDARGAVLARSSLLPPDDAAPNWFVALSTSPSPTADVPLAPPFRAIGPLVLMGDPRNEIAEAWSDARLTLVIMALFFAMVLALAFATIKGALSPLRDICAALSRIGTGDYSARIVPAVSRELAPLREGFNGMAIRLEEMGLQNRALHEQIMRLQEEERAQLARNLHDDVGPFLFAVGADAAMIRQYLRNGAVADVGPRAEAIADAVEHMQRHLKDILRRLAPVALLDLGLPGAIDHLIAFWKMRCPNVAFDRSVTGDPLDPPFDAIAFRVVQESLSNAIRHAQPTTIEITVDVDDQRAIIVVEDDGLGFSTGKAVFGFGLTGMQERVRSIGGTIAVRSRADRTGVTVEAVVPLHAPRGVKDMQIIAVPA